MMPLPDRQRIDSGEDFSATEGDDLVSKQVVAYWRELGLTDQYLVRQFADECIAHARRRVAHDASEEILRRAIEEVQRRFDHALARSLGLPPSRDQHPISAARAAILLYRDRISADALFLSAEASAEAASKLREILPRCTPPEAQLTMKETPLSFWLFKSTHR